MSNNEELSQRNDLSEIDILLQRGRPIIEKGTVHKNPDGSIAFITVPARHRPIPIGEGKNLKAMAEKLSPLFDSMLDEID